MIINPGMVAANKVIGNIESLDDQVQQNGIDLTVKSIEKLSMRANVLKKNFRSHTSRENIEFWEDDCVLLEPGIYDITLNETIDIPKGMAAPQIYTRSTVNRGWNFIHSGFWDTGYHGPLGVMFYVNVPIILEKWVRIGQIVFQSAEEFKEYEGIYNNQKVA